ncbi:MAG: ABC transporter ATP-binding protein [Finegoldia magna]|uniref:ABC transporter ATP-binding protein n=1 Tax=Finegoldia magna TaxID=1260 RepID=A0A943LC87_FINMA|nr:ABC transporter ATP-binding protein [Finegoldia magna]MBS5964965.1 ABC transporter ATP-binding protein [Finegoldia magna]MDU2898592.1 ABC transporter ATP-binding protein [Finegoldia magna]MDU5369623.1 ABC transporter ATP-binding protein [Finegoldia magna]MDU5444098.1 ABC transporter ATP-binding protein [Finegoldia magna]
MENLIEVRGLVKKYKELTAVDNLDLDVKKGEILGLLGPNGSGKSTTINCILSLLKKDAGSVKIFGKEMSSDAYDIKKRIGVVFQDVAVYDELSVYENVDYFCGLYIQDKNERKKLVERALDLVSLNDFVKFKPKKLSGGLLRRLNIACGIAHKPEIIILDEPTVAVDPQSRNNILEGIKKLNKEGSTIIYTSHYMDEVDFLCDDIVIIDKGKVIAKGTSEQLKDMIEMNEKISFTSKDLSEDIINKIKALPHLLEFQNKNGSVKLDFAHGDGYLMKLVKLLDEENIQYSSLNVEKPSLNDVFLELTGKDLRD